MESDRIKFLLEKYWSCEATLEEEQELRDWFRSQGNPDGYMEEQALFRYFDQARTETGNLDDRAIIHQMDENHKGTTEELKPRAKRVVFPDLGVLMKIAAGIVIALAATLITLRPDLITGEEPAPQVVLIKDTFENPEEAYAETMKALQLISNKMNIARKQTAKVGVYSEAEETVKEEIIN